MSVVGTVLRIILERSSRNLTYEQAIDNLQTSGSSTASRMASSPDTPKNRKQAAHIIGIEHWGQRRLRVALGQPLVVDEYDSYRPSEDLSMAELRQIFESARAETLALVRELQQNGVALDRKVFHNDAKDLTVRSWFSYLGAHASRESLRIR